MAATATVNQPRLPFTQTGVDDLYNDAVRDDIEILKDIVTQIQAATTALAKCKAKGLREDVSGELIALCGDAAKLATRIRRAG